MFSEHSKPFFLIKQTLKGTLFTRYNIGLGFPQNVSVKYQSQIPHRSFIISAGVCHFLDMSKKRADLECMVLNANELQLHIPAPSPEEGVADTSLCIANLREGSGCRLALSALARSDTCTLSTCTLRHLHFREWCHLQSFLFCSIYWSFFVWISQHFTTGGEDKKK